MKVNATLYRLLSNRPLVHIGFWLGYLLFFSLLRAGDAAMFGKYLLYELISLPVKMAAVYLTLTWFIPRQLLRMRYEQFFFSIVFTVIAGGLLFRAVIFYLVYPLQYEEVILHGVSFWDGYKIAQNALEINMLMVFTGSLKIMKHWYEREQHTRALEREKLEAELKFLKAQIHPHFLFNTLNNLYALTLKKSDHAPEVVLKLSGLVNYMLYYTRAEQVPLSKEIESIHNYIALEKIRYGTGLDISFDIAGAVAGAHIAPMLLLPFVENSFKHGVSDEIQDKWITLNLRVEGQKLRFQIENSKSPRLHTPAEKDYTGGIGLKNVRRRLELLYPKRHELRIIEEEHSYLVILNLELADS
ncbi:MAG: sensor histidine kinase [Bacteroidetes bacterium]|nr:MAG: sensor histidine kinase [Bacteroidota bacterium]